MNLINISQIQVENVSKLARIFTGYRCNLNCKFCYYCDTDKNSKYGVSDVIDQLISAKQHGMTGVEFSGGESSFDPNFNVYISYAKKLGFTRISTITNGRVYSDIERLQSSIDAGLNDILVSIHGFDDASYRRITGCTNFVNITATINNCTALNFPVRTNVTVTNDINSGDVSKMLEYVSNMPIVTGVNFILFNNFVDAVGGLYNIDNIQSFVLELVKIRPNYQHLSIKLRYFPLCIVKDCLDIAYNYVDQIYDTMDWHIATNVIGNDATIENIVKVVNNTRLEYYIKPNICETCPLTHRCDGLKKGWDVSKCGL